MAGAASIEVKGLKELRKSLKGFETDVEWKPALKNAYTDVAEPTAEKMRTASGSTRLGSRGRATIKGKATTTMARVDAFKGIAYGAGYNFGSSGRYPQFPPKASPDHFMYSVIAREGDNIRQSFADAIDKAFAANNL